MRPLISWFRKNRRDLPWRVASGRRRDPYRVWVAEIMLQQTTVKAVVPCYERFLSRFPDIETLARAREATVLAAWSGLGYYRRARHLHAAARLVAGRHGGHLPDDKDALAALPGIGRYTRGAILSLAFDRNEPLLDGNVERVLCRLLGERRDPRRRDVRETLWAEARRLVEASSSPGDFNEGLMELGATVCRPGEPDCPRCPIARGCHARLGGFAAQIPPPRRRPDPVSVKQTAYLVERDGKVLLRHRSAAGLMQGLWEFPDEARALGIEAREALGAVRHTVLNRRIAVTVRRGRLTARTPAGCRFVAKARIARLPVSSLVHKILTIRKST